MYTILPGALQAVLLQVWVLQDFGVTNQLGHLYTMEEDEITFICYKTQSNTPLSIAATAVQILLSLLQHPASVYISIFIPLSIPSLVQPALKDIVYMYKVYKNNHPLIILSNQSPLRLHILFTKPTDPFFFFRDLIKK